MMRLREKIIYWYTFTALTLREGEKFLVEGGGGI